MSPELGFDPAPDVFNRMLWRTIMKTKHLLLLRAQNARRIFAAQPPWLAAKVELIERLLTEISRVSAEQAESVVIKILDNELRRTLEAFELPEGREEEQLQERLTAIAREHLSMETLEERKSDSLDFKEVSVWGVRYALMAAYWLGRSSTTGEGAS